MKSLKYLALGAAVSLSLTACSDYLDPDNKSTGNVNSDAYFAANPEATRVYAYNSLYKFYNCIEIQDLASDLYYSPRSADDGAFARFTVDAINGTIKDYYKNCYNLVKYASGMCHFGGEGTLLEAEGIFFRNYAYYLLTQQFGGVPYFTHYVEDTERSYPIVPLSEMYPAMIAELEGIYDGAVLPAQDHNGNVSKQAVAALLAELYLSAAWDLDTEFTDIPAGKYKVNDTARFKKAAEWAEKAINGIQLTMSFAEKWNPKNEGNAEEIFSIQYNRATPSGDVESSGHDLHKFYTCYFGNCSDTGLKPTSGGGHQSNMKSIRLWDAGDERYEATFLTTIYNSNKKDGVVGFGTEGYYAPYNASAADLAKLPIAYKFFPWYATDADVIAWMKEHQNQLKSFPKGSPYGTLNTWAVRFDDPSPTIWAFNEDGSLPIDADGNLIADDKRSNASYYESAAANGTTCRKWDDPEMSNAVNKNNYRDIVKYHVSMMYLTAAEAYLLAGDEAKALQKINAVRTRAKAGTISSFGAYEPAYTTSSSFDIRPLDLILDEYARECYAEQHRYFELRRTKQLVRYNIEFSRNVSSPADMQNLKGEYKLLRPFPEEVFNNNTAVSIDQQNPGY
ncbi:MAG: RagB/SusD family nutrient uptake outer membrane protein [Duncaniella sp.]|nr:RagB/SusD family nutrient uptake outer membrane protein [Duncaniella sp.]